MTKIITRMLYDTGEDQHTPISQHIIQMGLGNATLCAHTCVKKLMQESLFSPKSI